jgi:release factor glutamine methyltransferase
LIDFLKNLMSQIDLSNVSAPYFNAFRPSEYTAAMVHVLEVDCQGRQLDRVIDIGAGAGIFLAALARLGAKELCGIDVSAEAVAASRALLSFEAPGCMLDLKVGDIWEGVAKDQRFDVIVANLPHFPGGVARGEGRPESWSGSGSDLLLRYLEGLPTYLNDSGCAYMTLSDIVGAEHIFKRITELDLEHQIVFTWTSAEPQERMQSIHNDWVRKDSTSLRSYGGYHFLHARILKITKLAKPSS